MSPEEKLEMGRKLIAEAEAEIAAKKRNWPEKVGPGDCFERNGARYVMFAGQLIDLDRGGTWAGVAGFDGNENDFTYLGKLDLTIRTDAREPTGAELVGKVCEAMGVKACRPVTAWSPTLGVTWADDDAILSGAAAWHKNARLAR